MHHFIDLNIHFNIIYFNIQRDDVAQLKWAHSYHYMPIIEIWHGPRFLPHCHLLTLCHLRRSCTGGTTKEVPELMVLLSETFKVSYKDHL